MTLYSRFFPLSLLFLGLSSACSKESNESKQADNKPHLVRSLPDEAPGLAQEIGAGFFRNTPLTIDERRDNRNEVHKTAFFSDHWNASFELAEDGSLHAVTKSPEQPPSLGKNQWRTTGRDHLSSYFPTNAAGELRVNVGSNPDTWIKERLVNASSAVTVQVSDGRVVYKAAKPGIDRVYEVSGQRVEEYLRIENAEAAKDISYEIETGPGIADIVVDGSGYGLNAVDAEGRIVVKAPQPMGHDTRGEEVLGRLGVERTGERQFIVRMVLQIERGTYPLLLDPGWVSAASMGTVHYGHTATLLQNNKVLVVGGAPVSGASELYDPAVDTWSAVAVMASPRRYHTATLLPNGHVLVVGGTGNQGMAVSSAELYDPVLNTWTAAPSMGTARYLHTATLLPSNKVLIAAGGDNVVGPLSAAELYNPVTNIWVAAPPLAQARYAHTATLLPNGTVFIAAGTTNTSEVYDPVSNTWSPAATMGIVRISSTATLLQNGRVLVAGGSSHLISAELYDPGSNTWTIASSMTVGRQEFTATLLQNGKVLVAGGESAAVTTELYDPANDTWSAAGSLVQGRNQHTATLLPNGGVIVAGGFAAAAGSTAELYLNSNSEACVANNDCGSFFCVDGVCCDTACNQPCDVCSSALGATADGVCSPASAGYPGNPACANGLLCNGADAACPTSCSTDSDCSTDRYCAADATCAVRKSLGQSCDLAAGQDCLSADCRACQSNHCVDAVCCDTACSGSCDVCILALGSSTDGTCEPAPAGYHAPECAPAYSCNGMATECPSGPCATDADCATDRYCDATQTCSTRKVLGAPCNPIAGADCLQADCRECSSDYCVDGVCCNNDCAGPCDACSVSKGASADGACTLLPDGAAGDPPCVGSTCKATSNQCGGGCTSDNDCTPAGGWCDMAAQQCQPQLDDGQPCDREEQCGSGFCVDDVCCNDACTGTCQACSKTKKGFGEDGTCGDITIGEDPEDECPENAPGTCLYTGACDGKGACQVYDVGTLAEPGTCNGTDGVKGFRTCDGAGQKTPPQTKTCVPFACDPTEGDCKTTCVTSSDCSEGAVCSSTGLCTLGERSCSNATTVKDADGSLTSCEPYRCESGECTSTCSKDSDCASSATCESGQCIESNETGGTGGGNGGTSGNSAAPKAANDSGCGCKTTVANSTRDAAWVGLGLMLAAGIRRRSRNQ